MNITIRLTGWQSRRPHDGLTEGQRDVVRQDSKKVLAPLGTTNRV